MTYIKAAGHDEASRESYCSLEMLTLPPAALHVNHSPDTVAEQPESDV